MNKHTWKTRNLISIFMMLAFTLMTASGVILYIVLDALPHGPAGNCYG